MATRLVLVVLIGCGLPGFAPAQQPPPSRTTELFLYIDDTEVRNELLIPLGALESLMPVQHDDPSTLTLSEQTAAEKIALGVLDSMTPVTIDGIGVTPSGGRVVFFDRDVTDIVGDPPKQELPAERALVGVILRYQTKGAPQRVSLKWSAFNEVITSVNATLYAEDKDRLLVLSAPRPALEWVREGAPRQPVLTEVPEPKEGGWLRAAPAVSPEDAHAIFSALLRNIYRAFDFRDEAAIYDTLERSVAGGLLAQLYLNLRRGLEEEAEGGPTSRVLDVTIAEGKLLSAAAGGRQFTYQSDWTVTGSVEHWGHVHTRKNLYRAQFTIAVTDGAWKIQKMQVQKQERLETTLVRRGATP